MSIRHFGAYFGGSLTAIVLAQTAYGQADQPAVQPPGASALEEIVVTATRRSERLQNVPMTIDVATGEQIKKFDIFDFKDVNILAPGLELTNSQGRDNTATLRGIPFDPDSGTLPAVDVYYNEIPVDAQTAFTAIYDVEQIEVLHGPQGLLRGRTSPAGSITLKTQDPSLTEFNGYVQATGSDQNAYNFQGAVSVPIIADKLAIRVAGLGDQNDINKVRDVTNNTTSLGHTQSGRVSIAAQPDDDIKAILTYQYLYADNVQNQQVIGPGTLVPATAGFLPTIPLAANGPAATPENRIGVSAGQDEFRNRTHLITTAVDWDIGEHNVLSLNAAYQDTVLNQLHSLNLGNIPLGYGQEQHTVTPYDTTTVEVRLSSADLDFWNYSVGADFIRELNPVNVTQPNDTFLTGLPASLLGLPAYYGTISLFPHYSQTPVGVSIYIPDQNTQYSGFASSSFQFTDALRLELGARFQIYRTHQQSDLTVTANGAPVETNVPTISENNAVRTYHAWTGGADLRYQLDPDLNAYISYGHSFRPGVAAVGITAPLNNKLLVTGPETSDAVEIGFKGDAFAHRLQFNADAFYQHFNGYIGRTVDSIYYSSTEDGVIGGSAPLNYNGDAESEGIEGDVGGLIIPGWDADVKFSYVYAHYDNAEQPCNVFNASGSAIVPIGQQVNTCPTDGRIAETPRFHLTVTSEYDYDTGTSYEPYLRGLFTYQPGFHSSVVDYNYDDLPLLNLYAGVRNEDQGWDLSVFAKNLIDIQRVTNITQADYQQATSVLTPAFALAAGRAFDSGYRPVNVSLPREIGVTLRYRFGGALSEPEAAPAAYTPPPPVPVAQAAPHSYLVFFDFNRSDLTSQAVQIVDQAAKNAEATKVTQLTVTGHTDTVGSDAYNLRLSRRRAESVAAQLEKDGIPSSEIEIVAKGKHDLLVPTADGVREPQNRRVQIVYSGGSLS